MKIKEVNIKSWKHLKDEIGKLSPINDSHSEFWIFRGQGNHKWKLTTTLERNALQFQEDKMISSYQRNAHLYEDTSKLKTKLDWLSFMQHHGTPTRLMDWTKSPYVALFFALNNAEVKKNEYCSVWMINLLFVYNEIEYSLKRKNYKNINKFHFINECTLSDFEFESIFYNYELPYEPFVFPILPIFSHQRINIQQGLFLVPTNMFISFEDNLKNTFNGQTDEVTTHAIRKFNIPNKLKPEIITELNYMNINDATLFPGIEGFSKFVSKKHLLFEETNKILYASEKKPKKK